MSCRGTNQRPCDDLINPEKPGEVWRQSALSAKHNPRWLPAIPAGRLRVTLSTYSFASLAENLSDIFTGTLDGLICVKLSCITHFMLEHRVVCGIFPHLETTSLLSRTAGCSDNYHSPKPTGPRVLLSCFRGTVLLLIESVKSHDREAVSTITYDRG